MRRRDLLSAVTGAMALRSVVALAEETKPPTVAILCGGNVPEFQIRVFRQGLRDLGYVEGRNMGNASDLSFAKTFIDHVERGGRTQQVQIVPVVVTLGPELDAAFPRMVGDGIEAVIVQGSLVNKHVAEMAIRNRLPAVSPFLAFPSMGALMAYGGVFEDNIRGAAVFVDKILKGAKPSDLPIQQPTRFQLIVNLRTAKALGLTVPQSLLARADEVIE